MKKRIKKKRVQVEYENYILRKTLEWIVHDINERKEEADAEEDNDFNNGIKEAYFEVTDMIHSRLDIMDIKLDINEDWKLI